MIRDARKSDLEGVFGILNEHVLHGTATFDTEPYLVGRDDAWLIGRDLVRHPVLVADEDGSVAGWAALSPWSERGAYARTAEVSVYVSETSQGEGVGRALMRALIERAREAGLGVLVARIAEGNPASAALFASLGFHCFGTQRRCGEKLGRILDVELLDLHLDGG
ncbi:MAG TPA: GNAT family N-acetyltransferase [Thermoleophilaceae bacterium]|nr:GNAT family N-acetyltransferase [Thermoleophilaceae bacterium]